MRLTKYQRRAYAMRRVSCAVDRQITANSEDEKNKAGLWVMAWARVAKV